MSDKHHNEDHKRASDDIIIELLRLVQDMDRKLENHIKEEMEEFTKRMQEHRNTIDHIINGGFPNGDLPAHREEHENKILVKIKRIVRKWVT